MRKKGERSNLLCVLFHSFFTQRRSLTRSVEDDFFRLRLLRVRTPGMAGFLSLPGIIRASEIYDALGSPFRSANNNSDTHSGQNKRVLVESFLYNLSIGAAVREMDTVDVEG